MKGRRLFLLVLLAAAALAPSGCGGIGGFGGMGANNETNIQMGSAPYTDGSGNVVTASRDLTGFHAVSVESGLTVIISHGSKATAQVSADDNLVALIATDVAGGVLTIKATGGLRTHHQIKVTVTASDSIDALTAMNGSTVDFQSFDAAATTVVARGGSTLRGGGSTKTLTLTADGGSTADLRNVEAETASVDVNGGSTAHVKASASVGGTCRGGSTTVLHGSPSNNTIKSDTGSSVRTE